MIRPIFEVRRYQGTVTVHSHDHHQAVLPLDGQLEMTIGTRSGSVSADNLALIAANVRHSFRGSEGNSFLVIDIPSEGWTVDIAAHRALWDHTREHPFIRGAAELQPFVRYLADATQRGQLRGENQSRACALLLGIIATQVGNDEETALPASLRAVRGYVDTHLEWPLSVAELAQVGSISESRLHALFRHHLATTPRGYVAERRLQRASQLLEQTALSIGDIAQRVGYCDQGAFSRAFKRYCGKSPGAHRVNSQES